MHPLAGRPARKRHLGSTAYMDLDVRHVTLPLVEGWPSVRAGISGVRHPISALPVIRRTLTPKGYLYTAWFVL